MSRIVYAGLAAITAGIMMCGENLKELPDMYSGQRNCSTLEQQDLKQYNQRRQYITDEQIIRSQKVQMLASGMLIGIGLAGIVSGYRKDESEIQEVRRKEVFQTS